MPVPIPSTRLARGRGLLAVVLVAAAAACRTPPGDDVPARAGPAPAPAGVDRREAPAEEPAGAGVRQDAAEAHTPAPPPTPEEAATPEEIARLEAQAALAEGDFAAARTALDALMTRPRLDAARAELLEGRLVEALAEVDEALEEAPSHAPSLLLRGSLLVALANRSGETQRLPEALDTFQRAGGCGPALERGARVALRLERVDEALGLARLAAELLPEPAWVEAEALASLAWPSQVPERTLAEAALEAWRRRGGAQAPEAQALFDEAEEALAVLLSRRPADPWVWRTLGEAYLEARRPAEARAAAERGLERLPGEEQLYELLARAARGEGGARRVLVVFGQQQSRRPREALVWWYPALERFRLGLQGGPGANREFRQAERGFRSCRAREPQLERACLRYEALCNTGQGWDWLERDDLVRAEREFGQAADVLPGGLELSVVGRLEPAGAGLQQVLERYLERESLAGAARVAQLLWEHSPADEARARQAAALQRDLGDRLQLESSDLRLAYKDRLDDEQRLTELRAQVGIVRPGDDLIGTGREKDLFREAYQDRDREASRAYGRSLAALRAVAGLDPQDLRARYTAAALAVQRLGEELDWAEEQLLTIVEDGRARLEPDELDEQERFTLLETWGDAHQLLGELELEHRGRPQRARRWFERCLEIGPLPRPEVSEYYLPRCLEGGR